MTEANSTANTCLNVPSSQLPQLNMAQVHNQIQNRARLNGQCEKRQVFLYCTAPFTWCVAPENTLVAPLAEFIISPTIGRLPEYVNNNKISIRISELTIMMLIEKLDDKDPDQLAK